MHRGVSSLDVSLYEVEVYSELINNPYRMNEREPSGEPLFRTTIPVDATSDELGVTTVELALPLIPISDPTRQYSISYAAFCSQQTTSPLR